MFRFRFWKKRKEKRTFDTIIKNRTKSAFDALIENGTLTPVTSFEQYSQLVKDAKANAEHRLYTNNYMMPDEIQRLIGLKSFYSVKTDNGLAFVDNEVSHYYMFLHVDLEKEIHIPQLDKNVLVETVYVEKNVRQQQLDFEKKLTDSGFSFASTYRQIYGVPQLAPEKYWKTYNSVQKTLDNEGKRFCVPTNRQLKQFEKIYREQIDIYVQKRFTKRERKKQRDAGYLTCIADKKNYIYAIGISQHVYGGAIACNKEYTGSIYASALMYHSYKGFYENIPQDPEAQKEYMRSRTFGWIATTNTMSLRLHKAIGMGSTGKAMNQFVLPAAPKK